MKIFSDGYSLSFPNLNLSRIVKYSNVYVLLHFLLPPGYVSERVSFLAQQSICFLHDLFCYPSPSWIGTTTIGTTTTTTHTKLAMYIFHVMI